MNRDDSPKNRISSDKKLKNGGGTKSMGNQRGNSQSPGQAANSRANDNKFKSERLADNNVNIKSDGSSLRTDSEYEDEDGNQPKRSGQDGQKSL